MPSARRAALVTPPRFAAWAVAPWIVLLLAALGCAQYFQHGERAYLAAALAVFFVSGACVLRLRWARPAMQWLAVLLAAWALVTGVLMLGQWGAFDAARQQAIAQPQLGPLAVWMIDRAQRTWEVGLVLKGMAVPCLLWLAWQLGTPTVRDQFRAAN